MNMCILTYYTIIIKKNASYFVNVIIWLPNIQHSDKSLKVTFIAPLLRKLHAEDREGQFLYPRMGLIYL